MSWREDLVPASISGVKILVKRISTTSGRKTQVEEFPGSDQVGSVDLGLAMVEHRLEVFTVGAGYHSDLGQLLQVLHSEGPHTFVHPVLGSRRVRLKPDSSISTQTYAEDERGMARVSFDLVEVSEKSGLSVVVSVQTEIDLALANVDAVMLEALEQTWPSVIVPGIADKIQDVALAIQGITSDVLGPLAVVDSITSAVQQVIDAADDLASSPGDYYASMVSVRDTFVAAILDADSWVSSAASTAGLAVAVIRSAAALSTLTQIEEVDVRDPLRYAEEPRDEDLDLLSEGLTIAAVSSLIASAVSVLAASPPVSAVTAANIGSLLADASDFASSMPSIEVDQLSAIRDLASAARRIIDGIIADPTVVTLDLRSTTHILLVAHEQTGDPLAAESIMALNSIPKPYEITGEVEVPRA